MAKLLQMRSADICIFCCLIIFCLPIGLFAQDSSIISNNRNLQLHGYVKDLQSVFFNDRSSSLITGNLIHNRIGLKWDISHNLYTRIEARNRLFYGEQVKRNIGFGKVLEEDHGLADLSFNWINDTSFVLNTQLDRALLNWSINKWEISFGRQRINWGINLVWNPNDIFNAYNYLDFDYEERPGTDAIRAKYFSGDLSSFEIAFKLNDKKNEMVGALLYKTNYRGYDLQYFSGIYFNDIVVGTAWAGNISDFGFKGEASYFIPYEQNTDSSASISLSLSFDRSFRNDYFAVFSYLLNSNAHEQDGNIAGLGNTLPSAKNLMPFEHSFLLQVNKVIHPLLSASLGFIYSPAYNSLILLPALSGSLSTNWDLVLLAQSFFSENSGIYKTQGTGIYLSLRYSY